MLIDESSLVQEKKILYELRAKKVLKNFTKKNIRSYFVSNRKEALSLLLEMIPPDAVVGRSDSLTLNQIAIMPELEKRNQNKLINPYKAGSFPEWEEHQKMMQEALSSDIFLTGTNAMTLDGQLVNIDGIGNRVSPMIFGPKKVIIVADAKKIVKDVNEAMERIRNYVAPLNNMRHYLKNHLPGFGNLPCVKTGFCANCNNHEWRCMHYIVIIDGAHINHKDRINVILVGEELGI